MRNQPELGVPENPTEGRLAILIKHYSEAGFLDALRVDLAASIHAVAILSPFLSQNRAVHYYPVFHALSLRAVVVDVFTRPLHQQPESLRDHAQQVMRSLERCGVRVHLRPGMHEKIAAIDGKILWHGSLNILSHNDTRESMLRFESPELVKEILADLGLLSGPEKTETDSRDAATESRPESVGPGGQARPCPVCAGPTHFFNNVGLWICDRSPACSGMLSADAIPTAVPRVVEGHSEAVIFCPVCGKPMIVQRGVFVRIVCSSDSCGFALDPRLAAGIVRILSRRQAA
jgi:ribosomal protein L37AE/L43A